MPSRVMGFIPFIGFVEVNTSDRYAFLHLSVTDLMLNALEKRSICTLCGHCLCFVATAAIVIAGKEVDDAAGQLD